MSRLNTSNLTTREHWLEFALHSALGPTPAPPPKTWLSSVYTNLKRSTPLGRTSVERLFDGISNKRIIIAGLDDGGKTTLLYKAISIDNGKDVTTRIPYVGLAIESVAYPSGVTFHTLDVGGCSPHSYLKLEQTVCEVGDAIVWVVDAHDRDRFVETREEFRRCVGGLIKRHDVDGEKASERSVPIIILMNKCDFESCLSKSDMSDALGEGFDSKNIFETESKTGKGVNEAFGWLADLLRNESAAQMEKTAQTEKDEREDRRKI